MTEPKCPACGATDIKDKIIDVILNEPFGGQDIVKTHEIECSTCGTRGDFFNENDAILSNAHKKLKQKGIENIINDFADYNISMSAIERALEMPQRTLTKWKNGISASSSSGIALMRFIRLFPWLLEVAEKKYDYNESQRIHINAAVKQLLPALSFSNNFFTDAGIISDSQSTIAYMRYMKRDNEANNTPWNTAISHQKPSITIQYEGNTK